MKLISMKYFCTILLGLSISPVFSQISFEERIEFEIKDGYVDEEFYEMGKDGVIIRTKAVETDGNDVQWKFEKYNTNLESVWTEFVSLPRKMFVDETYITENALHTLFKDKKGNFQLVSVEAKEEEITEVGGEVLKKTAITDMTVLGDFAFCEAYIKREPYLFSVNWVTGKQRLIPISLNGFKSKDLYVKSFQVLEESGEVFVYVSARVSKKVTELFVIRLDDEGQKKTEYQLTKSIDKNLIGVSARAKAFKKQLYSLINFYSLCQKPLSFSCFSS